MSRVSCACVLAFVIKHKRLKYGSQNGSQHCLFDYRVLRHVSRVCHNQTSSKGCTELILFLILFGNKCFAPGYSGSGTFYPMMRELGRWFTRRLVVLRRCCISSHSICPSIMSGSLTLSSSLSLWFLRTNCSRTMVKHTSTDGNGITTTLTLIQLHQTWPLKPLHCCIICTK